MKKRLGVWVGIIALALGWLAFRSERVVVADAANVRPGKTVAVVGDDAVGLLGVLSARQMGARRIIAMSRHESRQKLAREYGATDIVTDRGDKGVARIKELTNGIGADSVLECVGTQESMMQAIRSTRPGGYVGRGVVGGEERADDELTGLDRLDRVADLLDDAAVLVPIGVDSATLLMLR